MEIFNTVTSACVNLERAMGEVNEESHCGYYESGAYMEWDGPCGCEEEEYDVLSDGEYGVIKEGVECATCRQDRFQPTEFDLGYGYAHSSHIQHANDALDYLIRVLEMDIVSA